MSEEYIKTKSFISLRVFRICWFKVHPKK